MEVFSGLMVFFSGFFFGVVFANRPKDSGTMQAKYGDACAEALKYQRSLYANPKS